MTCQLRYVRHHEVPEYEAQGWTIASDLSDCHHGEHAVLMVKHER